MKFIWENLGLWQKLGSFVSFLSNLVGEEISSNLILHLVKLIYSMHQNSVC